MNPAELSVEEYDALVDAGQIVAWSAEEGNAVSRENLALRAKRRPDRGALRACDSELRVAINAILAYKLKTPPSRKPRVKGVEGSGAAWRG